MCPLWIKTINFGFPRAFEMYSHWIDSTFFKSIYIYQYRESRLINFVFILSQHVITLAGIRRRECVYCILYIIRAHYKNNNHYFSWTINKISKFKHTSTDTYYCMYMPTTVCVHVSRSMCIWMSTYKIDYYTHAHTHTKLTHLQFHGCV